MSEGHASVSISGAGEELGTMAASLIVSAMSEESRNEILQWAIQQVISRESSRRNSYSRDKVPSMLEQAIALALDAKMRDVAREMIEAGYGDLEVKVREQIDSLIGGLIGDDDGLRSRVRQAVMRELSE